MLNKIKKTANELLMNLSFIRNIICLPGDAVKNYIIVVIRNLSFCEEEWEIAYNNQ